MKTSNLSSNPFQPSDRMLRQFSGLWIVFFGLLAARQEFGHQRHSLAVALAALAAIVGTAGLLRPRLVRPIFVTWMGLAYPIGWVVSRVVMALLFYGLFTPVALVFRFLSRDALRLKRQPNLTTYWVAKPPAESSARYLRQS